MEKRSLLIVTLSTLLLTSPLRANWQQGLESFSEGHYEDALEQFRIVVSQNSDYTPGHYMVGLTLYKLGRIDDAIQGLSRAVELAGAADPADQIQYTLALARAQLRAERPEAALTSLTRHRLSVVEEKLRHAYAQLLAMAASHSGKSTKVAAILEQAVEDYPASKPLWLVLGTMRKAEGDLEGRFAALDQAFELDRKDVRLGTQVVSGAFELAKVTTDEEPRRHWYRRAAAVAERLVLEDDSIATRLLLGEARLGAQDYAAAKTGFEELTVDAPDNALFHYYLARCHLAQGDDEEALASLSTALDHSGDEELRNRIHETQGYVHHRLRQFDLAARAYEKAGNQSRAAEMRRAVEADKINREHERKKTECQARKAKLDEFRRENDFLTKTKAWDELERKMAAELADCQPYL